MLHLLAHFLHTLLHLGVHRGILQMGTDVVGDVAQGKRQPERDAPAQSTTKDESAPQTVNMNVARSEPTSRPVAVEAGTIEQ